MTDAPARRRPRFQIHLSTCIVLMFVAGAIVLLNMIWLPSPKPQYKDAVISDTSTLYHLVYDGNKLGWPWAFYYIRKSLRVESDNPYDLIVTKPVYKEFSKLALAGDIGIWILLLLFTFVLCNIGVKYTTRKHNPSSRQ